MKKMLLFVSALLIGFSVNAQKRNLTAAEKLTPASPYEVYFSDYSNEAALPEINNSGVPFNRSGDLLKVDMSSSSNFYGIFSMDQRIISAQPETNTIIFGNRAGGSFGATGNDLRVSYSTDLGYNWTNFVINPEEGLNFRYPSVATYNPDGNTDPDNMVVIYSGPYTDAGGWKGQFFGSCNMDGSNVQTTFDENEPNVYLNHRNIGLTATPSGHVHVASSRLNGATGAYTHEGWEVLNGTYNAETNQVDWQLPAVSIVPELLEDGRTDGDAMVFSPDGSVGYMLGTGIDADLAYNPYGFEWPIVYKTTDHGVTWEKIPEFDFSEIRVFEEHLFPLRADNDKFIPKWWNKWIGGQRANGVTVDMHGNLHIAGLLRSVYSLHPDSLNYYYVYEPEHMFDVFMNGDGTWNAQYIDTLRTEVAENIYTDYDLDQRMAMSRTRNGEKVFFTWGDTETISWPGHPTTNLLPDVFIWGQDVTNQLYTDPTNVTVFGDYWGENKWLQVSDMVITEGDIYHIPTSSSLGDETSTDLPFLHQYLAGVWFTEAEFVNVDANQHLMSVNKLSQNYPNPSNGFSRVDITLAKTASVSLEVYNLVGQKVYEIPARRLSEGNHTLEIKAGNLTPGMYTYSVIANGERATRKMMVN
ncbi:MAG: T9SS type A sorting domain-containing protein [Lentimicrobium sp.]|jgi:hypothetical protein|nr:T9SS type A sorting domain-containing protein [Lentimicrobium sp.]